MTSKPDDLDRILQAAYNLHDSANWYWNFYVVVVGIVLGWVFNKKEEWQLQQKMVVTFIFWIFAISSIQALSMTYSSLNDMAEALSSNWGIETKFKKALVDFFDNEILVFQMILHILVDFIVTYFIWQKSDEATKITRR